MPLFAVERDLSEVPPDRLRLDLRGLVKACERLQGLGKKVRYISSAVFPAEARGLCLFGAEELEWIREVNDAAHLPYSRIFPVLDLTPSGVRRDLSCGRRALQPTASIHDPLDSAGAARNGAGASASELGRELARWSGEGRRLLQSVNGWLEEVACIQAHAATVQSEHDALAVEVGRLREENEGLRAHREELEAALRALAGQMTRATEQILQRFGRREAPGDVVER